MKTWNRKQQSGANCGKRRMSRFAFVSLSILALMLVIIATAAGAGVGLRVSTDATGAQANGGSYKTGISSDGRFVVFDSDASNLVAGDTNAKRDVFRKDTSNGQIARVSTDSAGNQQYGENPSMSADGRYVAFQSTADMEGDLNNKMDVFVKDTVSGTTARVSPLYGQNPAISGDGRYVAFIATSSISSPNTACGTVPGQSYYWSSCVFRHDTQTGSTVKVSPGWGSEPAISGDGRYVVFHDNNVLYVKDMQFGGMAEVVNDPGICGDDGCAMGHLPSISSNGRYVAFRLDDDNTDSVYLRDLVEGDLTLVHYWTEGWGFSPPVVSDDGRYVVYEDDSIVRWPYKKEIVVKDMLNGTTAVLSTDSAGGTSNGSSFSPSISGDGTRAVFASDASNLVSGDTNGVRDIFLAGVSAPICQAAKPALSLSANGAFWGSYDEYQADVLSVNYTIGNAGPGNTYGVQLTGAANTMGVGTASGIPGALGDIAAAGSSPTVIKYYIPAGVLAFKSSIYATADDSCGVSYDYPGPGPGA